jgi:hypothetical protein
MRSIMMLLVLAMAAWAAPARAEPRLDWVRGDIQAIRGEVLTVDGTDVTMAGDVAVYEGGETRPASSLAVGLNVTAVIEDGVCHKVEVHRGDKKVHGNGRAGKHD